MERPAIKQDLSVDEIEPAGFQHGDALRTLKIHPTEIYPRFWVQSSCAPKIRALVEATYFAGLRKAGMPEE